MVIDKVQFHAFCLDMCLIVDQERNENNSSTLFINFKLTWL